MGVKDHDKGNFKNILFGQLHEACEAMEEDGEKINLEQIIDTDKIFSFDLPSAISEPRRDIAGQSVDREERTPEFIIRCRELRQLLITMTRGIAQDESRQFLKGISSDYGWINYANFVWDLARQTASLWTFASVNEKFQRKFIEKELAKLIQKYVTNYLQKYAMDEINRLMSVYDDIDADGSVLNFPTFVTQLQNECQSNIEKGLKEAIGGFPGASISPEVVLEYQAKVKRIVGEAVEEQRQILVKNQQDKRLQNGIDLKFQEVARKVDQLKGENFSPKQVEDYFDRFVQDVIA